MWFRNQPAEMHTYHQRHVNEPLDVLMSTRRNFWQLVAFCEPRTAPSRQLRWPSRLIRNIALPNAFPPSTRTVIIKVFMVNEAWNVHLNVRRAISLQRAANEWFTLWKRGNCEVPPSHNYKHRYPGCQRRDSARITWDGINFAVSSPPNPPLSKHSAAKID